MQGWFWSDGGRDAAANMAIDAALAAAAAESGEAFLRIYRWSEPSLTLGYFQAAADRLVDPALATLPYTRRLSGGGAIVHDRELTYALAMPSGPDKAAAGWLYESLHAWWRDRLIDEGYAAVLYRDAVDSHPLENVAGVEADGAKKGEAFLCFQRRSSVDVVADRAKIIGSAQRRLGGAILQQGSVLLEASHAAAHLPGLRDLRSSVRKETNTPAGAGDWLELFDRYSEAFIHAIAGGLVAGGDSKLRWSTIGSDRVDALLARSQTIAANQYRHAAWLLRR